MLYLFVEMKDQCHTEIPKKERSQSFHPAPGSFVLGKKGERETDIQKFQSVKMFC